MAPYCTYCLLTLVLTYLLTYLLCLYELCWGCSFCNLQQPIYFQPSCSFMLLSRFQELRKQHIADRIANPQKKSRHQKVDHRELVKRSEEDYVDFQEARSLQSFVPTADCSSVPVVLALKVVCRHCRLSES